MQIAIRIIIVAALAGVAPSLTAHEPASAPATSKQQAPEQRFVADATLRREMQGIRASVDALTHYEHGHMGPTQAATLAGAIEQHVQTIIANCKLPPDADAALHGIIVPLLQNASALKAKPEDLSAIGPMRRALEQYDRQFRAP